MSDDEPREAIEVEVERLDPDGEEAAAGADDDGLARLLRGAGGPIIAGLLVDLVDFATIGGMGAKLGLVVGGACGYWLAGLYGFPPKRRLWVAAFTAVYCALPGTQVLPFATVLGVLSGLWRPKES